MMTDRPSLSSAKEDDNSIVHFRLCRKTLFAGTWPPQRRVGDGARVNAQGSDLLYRFSINEGRVRGRLGCDRRILFQITQGWKLSEPGVARGERRFTATWVWAAIGPSLGWFFWRVSSRPCRLLLFFIVTITIPGLSMMEFSTYERTVAIAPWLVGAHTLAF